jgi:hypothetical protein
MDRATIEQMKVLYSEHQRLHTVGDMMNIPWQTVYWWLKKEGVSVTGNKEKHGGAKDQIAIIGEKLFAKISDKAVDQNKLMFQPRFDYLLDNLKLDVKTSFLRSQCSRGGKINLRWAFNCKKQQEADYLICYCLSGGLENYVVENILLIPNEFIQGLQTISVSPRTSKWLDFGVSEGELKKFFTEFLI